MTNQTNTRRKWAALPALLLVFALLAGVLPLSAVAAETPQAATTFTFSDSGVSADGGQEGYQIEGTNLTINGAGVYRITGRCGEGSITVKKGATGVTLILQDLTLASSTAAPLSCNKASQVTLYVTGENTLTDAEDPANEDAADEELADAFAGAAIKVKAGASLVITGDGTLTVDGSACKNGVKGGSDAAITVGGSVTLDITAANNGLASDGSVTVQGGRLNITAGNDGIKSEPDEDDTDSAGTVTVTGGSLTIHATGDGVQSTGALAISGGDWEVTTYNGYRNSRTVEAQDISAKGLKSDSKVLITGGSFTLDCADDAIHSNGEVLMTGGDFTIRTGDDAVHADLTLEVGLPGAESGPVFDVITCYEGLEAGKVILNAGSGSIYATDDGVNAATDESVAEIAIYLNGGAWTVNADGDGLDAGGNSRNNSGGTIYVNGGTTVVFGAANGGNAALDYDGSCVYSGGTLLAVGYGEMAQAPSQGVYVAFGSVSTGMGGQPGGMQEGGQMGSRVPGGMSREMGRPDGRMGMNGQQPGAMGGLAGGVTVSQGSSVQITDGQGKVLASTTAVKNANSVVFCSDALVSGESYALLVNGAQVATATAAGTAQSSGKTGTDTTEADAQIPGAEHAEPSVPPTESGTVAGYGDVSAQDWYAPYVEYVTENGVMNGVGGGKFAPDGQLTRAMMAQILYNLEGRPAVSGDDGFTDVQPEDWFADAVTWARQSGVVQGTGNGAFQPMSPVNRAQAAVFLRNYAAYKGEDVSAGSEGSFSDEEQVPAWAVDAMSWCVGHGILEGSGGKLNPTAKANRAQIAAIMTRYLQE